MFDSWIWPLSGGMLTGTLFFGGLWYTIIHGVRSAHPEVWFLVSLVSRFSLAVGGFVFLSGCRWDRLLACLAGFVLARVIVCHWLPVGRGTTLAMNQGGQSCA